MTTEPISKNTYETIEGTKPTTHGAHEPRTIQRHKDGDMWMMSEIGDGVFVQWGDCRRCHTRVYLCKCKDGPKEPEYMKPWRDARFAKDLDTRPDPDYDLLPSVIGWVKERGYAVALPAEVEEAVQLAQVAQDLTYGDSNDDEIDSLREALEFALGLLGQDLPAPGDEEDDDRPPNDEYYACVAAGTHLGVNIDGDGYCRGCGFDSWFSDPAEIEDVHLPGPVETAGEAPVAPVADLVDDGISAALARLNQLEGDQDDVGF